MTTETVLKSIADETRLSIIRRLAQSKEPIPCSELISDCSVALHLSQPTMSHHFTRLVQSGVLTEQKQGKAKIYTLNSELLEQHGINPHKL